VQVVLPRYMQGVVVAKVAIEDQVGQWDNSRYQLEQGVNHGFDPHQLRGERDRRLGFVRAALRTPATALFDRRWGLLGVCFGLAGGLLPGATYDLLDAQGKRASGLDTHERQGKDPTG